MNRKRGFGGAERPNVQMMNIGDRRERGEILPDLGNIDLPARQFPPAT